MMRTLVIVDTQNDFMPDGPLSVPKADEIVPIINGIQKDYDLIVATQDWHPKDHLSFASNHPGKEPFDIIDLFGIEQVLWPDHCVQNTEGAELHPGLDTGSFEAIIRKGMDPNIDSYSAFFDNGRRKRTGLAGYLRDRGVVEIHFCGLASEICVYYTIMDAVFEGFEASFLEFASRPLDREDLEKKKVEMERSGVRILGTLSELDIP